MDWVYLLLKFLHVTGVIVWIGGMLTLVIINARVGRGGDMAQLAALGQQSEFYGRSVWSGPVGGVPLTGHRTRPPDLTGPSPAWRITAT
jgi:uncharacterized membrane protein